MCSRSKSIDHWGYHLGREAFEVDAGAGLVPDSPQAADWDLVQDHLGILDEDEQALFIEGYKRGTKGGECGRCENHAHFMSVLSR